MKYKEIEERMAAIETEIDAADAEKLAELRSEFDGLKAQKDAIETREQLKADVASGKVGIPMEQPAAFRVHEQEKREAFTTASVEYRDAWAKTLLCQPLTAVEQRAMREVMEFRDSPMGPITTTATEFVAQTDGVLGQNNGGLFIPKDVSDRFLQEIVLGSPILEDVFKMNTPGLRSFPYEIQSGDAEWKVETECNNLEEIEWGELLLAAKELAKTIRVSWKLEAMTPTTFVDYLMREMRNKMQVGLATAHIYGGGVNDLNGLKNSDIQIAVAATAGAAFVDALVTSVNSIPNKANRMGLILYLSNALAQQVALAKDSHGDYIIPPINGAGITQIGTLPVKIDPYLEDNNFVVANLARDAILNTHEPLGISKDVMGRCRINDYTAYAIYSNAYKPGTIGFGTVGANPE